MKDKSINKNLREQAEKKKGSLESLLKASKTSFSRNHSVLLPTVAYHELQKSIKNPSDEQVKRFIDAHQGMIDWSKKPSSQRDNIDLLNADFTAELVDPTPAETLLLDDYPATAAYSLRKLRTAYSGSAIRVRIDTTGQPEYDIGFDSNGDLDTSDLISKAAGNDAFVRIWYDQSGNGNDVTQSSAEANQPQIVASGSVFTQNSLPTISFSSDYLTNAGSLTYAGGVSYFATFNSSTIGSVNRIWSDDITGVQGSIIAYSDNTNNINDNGGGYKSISFTASNGNQLRTLVFNDSNGVYNILQNGSSLASGTLEGWSGPIAASGASNIGIMSSGDGAQTLTGTMQELIIYGNDQSSNRTAIETNINDYYGIY